ncbi:hypothetical protein [Marinobacter salarius]|uniref:Antirestriction protein n=1 Tax=Marinobacter salarius TaxID=1420917 RepID=A0A1W6KFF7_9GAMM|nr:hypothetical protein [Marinobacter salarius]ARM86133.1 hypothetical protein MARSALSMR5_04113 [Marinobacter salarius]
MTLTEQVNSDTHQPSLNWQSWTIAGEHERLEFLLGHFLISASKADNLRYAVARKTITGYNGGYWEYAITPDGFGFVYPKSDAGKDLEVSNIFQDTFRTIHPVLAGIHTTQLMLLHIMNDVDRLNLTNREEERTHDHYYAIKDYGRQIAKQIGQASAFSALND